MTGFDHENDVKKSTAYNIQSIKKLTDLGSRCQNLHRYIGESS